MQEQENIRDKQSPGKKKWTSWLNYQSVVKQVPFFLFLTFLAVIYIYNGHQADKTMREISKTTREVKELRFEYKALLSQSMFQSKGSELSKKVESLGLKELNTAPAVIAADNPADKK
ncbi:MAG: FtsL-like putative cell division protein [Chitinophagaceae bacterium]|nr:FtsL-like putative cell division protein [Chitinophagaceae bacterium]